MVIMDVLDVLMNAPPDDPAWGLKLCEQTGHGTGTIYPALDRLLQADWIEDRWKNLRPQTGPSAATTRSPPSAALHIRRQSPPVRHAARPGRGQPSVLEGQREDSHIRSE